MRITLLGAANEVTGSCYLLETGSSRLLVDCGLFQGSEKLERLNKIPKSLLQNKLDVVLLTHGHLDHCGRLPLLGKAGYRGPICATQATIDIAKLILHDAAKIQQDDTERENRRRNEAGLKPLEPLFGIKDVQRIVSQFQPVIYNKWFDLAEGIKAQFVEAGHILGSSCVELVVDQNGVRRHLVFSGDLGQWNQPLLCDPARISQADVVFLESTYGDRDHRCLPDTLQEFHDLIATAIKNKGKVLIPTFAVGRTQQLLYYLAEMFREQIVPPIPVYLDSPMAAAATEIYAKHLNFMDKEGRLLHQSGQLQHDLQTLKICQTPEESKALNDVEGPCVILAGAGMCNAGRILHHLRHNLGNPNTIVLIVGYQTGGSVGRFLVEGAKQVKIFGETIKVRATIRGLGGFSAHAGQSDLLKWLEPMARHKPRVILTHGESHQAHELAFQIEQRFAIKAEIPKLGTVLEI